MKLRSLKTKKRGIIMGKYVVKKTNTGFNFQLKAGNGEPVASSEVYKAKKSCLNGIKSVCKNAPVAGLEDQTKEGFEKAKCPKFEVYADKKGEFRFRLKAANGQNVCHSEGYTTLKACLNGVESVRNNADSPVEEAEYDLTYF